MKKNAKTLGSGGSRDESRPLYRRLAHVVKEDIVSGVYPIGALLPTEQELCDRFVASRYTVREALRLLR